MSDDLIKRSDAIEAITYPHLNVLTKEERVWLIQDIPSADRPQGWIPCSERLPSGEDAVLVSTCAFDTIYDVVFMMAKDVERFYECGHVNAWMPSPEPWKGADDETD